MIDPIAQEVGLAYAATSPVATDKTGTDWARHYYPTFFNRPFTKFQNEFWVWGEAVKPGVYTRPRVECDPRGVGKSSNGEALCVRWLAKRVKRFIVIISRTEEKAARHFASIKSMLENPRLLADYPHLQPHVSDVTNRLSTWRSDALWTESGAIVMSLTMKSARGLKSAELNLRPDVILFDDIDLETDSPDVIAINLSHMRNDIIPAGDLAGETVYLLLQNLIHRDSICSQILDQRADILSDRIFCGPHKLLEWFDAVKEAIPGDDTGGMKWRITAAKMIDPALTVEFAEILLNRFGFVGFTRECMQNVDMIGEEKDFREWNEVYHISTWSEMVAGFHLNGATDIERGKIPPRWEVGKGLDWGTTVAHPTACSYFTVPDKRYPFSDIHLGIGEIVLPKFPAKVGEQPEIVSPGRVAQALKAFERGMGLQDAQMRHSKMSHEASAALNTFMVDLAEDIKQFFSKWKPAKGSGVPQMQNLMEIDYKRNHPFRCYPMNHPDPEKAGRPMKGRPRFILIVADGQGELYVDGEGTMRVRGPIDSKGFARARFEMPLYSQYNTGSRKIADDWVDSAKGIHATFNLRAAGLTDKEKVERATPLPLQLTTLEERQKRGENLSGAYAARLGEQERIRKSTESICYNSSVAKAREFRSRRRG